MISSICKPNLQVSAMAPEVTAYTDMSNHLRATTQSRQTHFLVKCFCNDEMQVLVWSTTPLGARRNTRGLRQWHGILNAATLLKCRHRKHMSRLWHCENTYLCQFTLQQNKIQQNKSLQHLTTWLILFSAALLLKFKTWFFYQQIFGKADIEDR